MSTTPTINLFTFTSDAAKPVTTGDRVTPPQGAEGFAAIFAGLMNKAAGDQTGVGETVTRTPGALAAEFSKLLPQLLKLYSKDFTEGLEVTAAGTVESSGQTQTELSGMGGDQATVNTDPDGIELMKRLLAGIAALFAAQQKGEAEGKQALGGSEAGSAEDAQGLSDDVSAQTDDPGAEVTIGTDNGEALDKSVGEMIALLLFGYLQSAQPDAEQQQSVTLDMGAIEARTGLDPDGSMEAGTTGPGQNAAGAAALNGNGVQQGSASAQAAKDLEKLLQRMMAAASGKEGAAPIEGTVTQVAMQAVFPKETLQDAPDASTIKNQDAKTAASTRSSFDALLLMAAGGAEGPQQETGSAIDNASESFVKGVSQLLETVEQQQKQVEIETKDQPAPKENYQVLADKEPGAKGVAEQKSAAQQASPMHAVEKFEKTLEQVSARTGLNEMRVRLNIGNDESVVLGLKDLGQTISVEVKASHQAIIGLLESQKDSITKNLELRDVHTNIFIDPDSSAKQDHKDRREGKQRLRTMRSRNEAEGFAEVLEVLS